MRRPRPQSYQITPEIVVRRDAAQDVWRVFVSSLQVYSTAGRGANERAMAYGRWLAASSVGMAGETL